MAASTRSSRETRMQDYPYGPVQAITPQDMQAALLMLPFKIILMRLESTAIFEFEIAYMIQLKGAREFDDVCSVHFSKFEQAIYTELQRFCSAL